MNASPVDELSDASLWQAVGSGDARLVLGSDIAPTGHALRMDYDFHGGGGFVVARRTLARRLPPFFALRFAIRGEGPLNHLELKLVDATGDNVWWRVWRNLRLPADWQEWTVPGREFEFAWGPRADACLTELGALEIGIAAGEGGQGQLWLTHLELVDRTPAAVQARASTAAPGFAPTAALHGHGDGWRSAASAEPAAPWYLLDFGGMREYGGLIIEWDNTRQPTSFSLAASDDGTTWRRLTTIEGASARRSFVPLPGGEARCLRLDFPPVGSGRGYGIRHIEVQPFAFSRSMNSFFGCVARTHPRGRFPQYLVGEQSYWTTIGTPEGSPQALISDEGRVEMQPGSCSLEPFVYIDQRLVSWADVRRSASLLDAYLPIPELRWDADEWSLAITGWAVDSEHGPLLYVRYRLALAAAGPRQVRLFIALRPFQVTPPWQAHQGYGGACGVRHLALDRAVANVDGQLRIRALEPADAAGAAVFHAGDITEFLARGEVPPAREVDDAFGHAAASWAWDMTFDHTVTVREIVLVVPLAGARLPASPAAAEAALAAVGRTWTQRLTQVGIELPGAAHAYVDTFRTCAAHVLVNRARAALQPGPRRYNRAWIRDGAVMGAALLRAGSVFEMRDFIRWYAGFQCDDGAVPCCVDARGADPLIEHDSHGQFVFAIAELVRYSDDVTLLAELWPAAQRALAHLETLCAGGERLLPESVSHEGYLAHPVHAYWDDCWALRALRDGAELAIRYGDARQAAHWNALARRFERCLAQSIRDVIGRHDLAYVPASVEWADFDPSATANTVILLGLDGLMPRTVLEASFRQYLADWRQRRDGGARWTRYAAYELRIVGALVRLGWRDAALELARGALDDRRPRGWNQWPEIVWRDAASPAHLGDLPHSWVGAEFMLACRDLFAYEDPAARVLVLAAGLDRAWLAGTGVSVRGLPTAYGPIDYTLTRDASGALAMRFAPRWTHPPATVIVRPPLVAPISGVTGTLAAVVATTGEELCLRPVAFDLRVRCAPPDPRA